ncbi:MAG: hypothetical protein KGI97_05850 [Alphaproteobacteria bacterium]|nr:hypothetical protein [Alphaproteobacteria bacterium]
MAIAISVSIPRGIRPSGQVHCFDNDLGNHEMRTRITKFIGLLTAVFLLTAYAAPARAQLVLGSAHMRPSVNPKEKAGTYIVYIPVTGIKADDTLLAIRCHGAAIDIIDNRDMLKGGIEHYIAINHLPLTEIQSIAAPNENYLVLRLVGGKYFKKPAGNFLLTFVYAKARPQIVHVNAFYPRPAFIPAKPAH